MDGCSVAVEHSAPEHRRHASRSDFGRVEDDRFLGHSQFRGDLGSVQDRSVLRRLRLRSQQAVHVEPGVFAARFQEVAHAGDDRVARTCKLQRPLAPKRSTVVGNAAQ